MTGYGAGTAKEGDYEIRAEIKSLNSKFGDITVRIPLQWSALELVLRKQIADTLVRGKISLNIEIVNNSMDLGPILDENIFDQYYRQFKRVADRVDSPNADFFSLALHSPGVLNSQEDSLDDDLSETIKEAVSQAIYQCDNFRTQEGTDLSKKLMTYVDAIERLLAMVDPFDKERIRKVEERLKTGLANISISTPIEIDNNRLEQELFFYIEKLDINEEKVRLSNHLNYFREVAKAEDINGKKLGFIAQEIGREINTIGSKANDSNIQRIVVEMKEELEKIKEQVLNVI